MGSKARSFGQLKILKLSTVFASEISKPTTGWEDRISIYHFVGLQVQAIVESLPIRHIAMMSDQFRLCHQVNISIPREDMPQ